MITCIITNKVYIGSTKNYEERLSFYKRMMCKKQLKVYKSLNKYGLENHIFEKIWEGNINEMLSKECILGNFYDVLDRNKGLNLRLPKIDDVYQSFSEEAKQNMSIAAKNKKPASKETIEKMRATKIKQGISPENKAKMIANLPRKPHSKEWNDNIRKGNLGKKKSDIGKFNMATRRVICNITDIIMTINEGAIATNFSYNHFHNMMIGKRMNKTSFKLIK